MKVERELQDRLHAAVCSGDPTASSRVFTSLLDPLVDALGFKWPNLRGTELLYDFAVDSVMSYLRNPQAYDPERASLLTYLRMDAHGDLLNNRERSQRAQEAESEFVVEESERQRKGATDEYASDREQPLMSLAEIREAFPDEGDRRAILLLIDGERSTDAFVAAWGLGHLPPDDHADAVKRNKDRLKARIRRMGKIA